MDAVSPDTTVSAADVPNNVHTAVLDTLVQISIGELRTEALKPMEVSANRRSEKIDEMEPSKAHCTAPIVSDFDDNAGTAVCAGQLCRKIYETVDVVANLGRTTDVPYSLLEIYNQHNHKQRASLQCNGFYYSMGDLKVTLRSIVDGIETAMEMLLVDDSASMHFKPQFNLHLWSGGESLQYSRSGIWR